MTQRIVRINELEKKLNEREKELNCFYEFSRLIEKHNISLNEILKEVPFLLSASWQYPEITCARIVMKDKEFVTDNFRISKWRQAADIVVKEKKIGFLDVFYLEERPELDEGPFLKKERKLIDFIAERLGRIIERKRLEEESKRQWEQFAAIIDNFAESLYISDPKTYEVLLVNKALEKALGRNPVGGLCYKEFQGRSTPCDFCTNDIIQKDKKPYIWEHHNPLINKDLQLTDQIIHWPDGRKVRYEIAIDITEHKKMEKELRTTNEIFEKIFSTTYLLIAFMDRDFNFIRVNRAYAEAEGREEKFFIGKNHFELYPNKENEALFQRVVKTGEPYTTFAKPFEYPEHPEKGVTYWDWTLQPVKDDTGDVKELLLCLLDVTESKKTEIKLSETKTFLEMTLSSLADVVFVVDPNTRIITDCNASVKKIFGYSQEEVIGRNTGFLHVSKETYEEFGRKLFHALDAKGMFRTEYKMRRKDGSVFFTENTITEMLDDSGKRTGVVSVVRDITARKRAEEDRSRLMAAVKNTVEGISVTDRDGIIKYLNPAFEKITGFKRDDIIDSHADTYLSGRHNGKFHKPFQEALRTDGSWRGRLKRKKGGDGIPYDVELTITPVCDDSGNVSQYVTVERDITHEIKLEKELQQSRKMEALGTLAGGISHDLNNILMPIILNTELALQDSVGMKNQSEYLNHALNAAQRGRELVKQIITFSRQGEQKQEPIRIASIIKEDLKLLKTSFPGDIKIREDIDDDPADMVISNLIQIHQILINLCKNAAHAMRETGGLLKISLKRVEIDQELSASHADLKPGHYLRLSVSDTGEGMDRERMERIFEPFFTTKERSEGTGMGLAVVHGIVKNHGGTITVYSEEGKGSTFNVFFPLVKSEPARESISSADIPKGKEWILLVDDDEPVLQSEKNMLEMLGYKVSDVSNSDEALKFFRSHPDDIDLIITDQTMPNMNGSELSQKIMEIRRDTPIILCAGLNEGIEENIVKEEGIREFILKPFTTKEMAGAIRRVLDE